MISKGRVVCSLLLIASLCIILVGRSHTFDEPLERDITTYAVAAHEMLNGRGLYSDVWDHKPPAVHATFALGEMVAGYGPKAISLLGIVAALATLAGLVAAVIWAGGNSLGVGCAALLWALTCSDLYLQANQPNTEVFLNAFLAWGTALSLRIATGRLSPWTGTASALCWAIASLYKMVAIALPAVLVPVTGFLLFRRGIRGRPLLGYLAIQLLIGEIAWMGVAAYFFATGRWPDFYQIVIQYNQAYAGDLAKILAGFGSSETWLPLWEGTGWILAGGALVGLIMLILRGQFSLLLLVVGVLLGASAAVMLPGRYYPHYLQLLLPPMVLTAALGLSEPFPFGLQGGRWKAVQRGVFLVVALAMAWQVKAQLELAPDEWARRKFGEIFIDSARLGEWLGQRTDPDDPIYEFGAETGLYFYSRRSPASGIFYDFPLHYGPYQREYCERVVREVMTRKPPVLILKDTYYEWLRSDRWQSLEPSAWRELFRFVDKEYVLDGKDGKVLPMVVFRRKDFAWGEKATMTNKR